MHQLLPSAISSAASRGSSGNEQDSNDTAVDNVSWRYTSFFSREIAWTKSTSQVQNRLYLFEMDKVYIDNDPILFMSAIFNSDTK